MGTLILFVGLVGATYFIVQAIGQLTTVLNSINTEYIKRGGPTTIAAAEEGEDTTPVRALRLQACERFTLMLERIAVPNLLLRLPPQEGEPVKNYTARLLLSIREEVEYNVTQQIYVSDSLWNIITQARDNVSQLIVRAAEGADSSRQTADRLRLMSSRQPDNAITVAQGAVRREASGLVGS